MKIHLRADSTNPEHTRFTTFIDGKNCGQLCMGTKDAVTFYMIVQNGLLKGTDEFVGSGHWNGEQIPGAQAPKQQGG